ncbi:16S rRNA (guanine(966)-N(2))-methyltransferase RsmD [Pseudovibrio brasiliensis]|uniref:16S rRNA (Guanine(966)-N(2))-methyltransferase RsmD n=1 Tax=Pseudovibrio brasiliensis TaxID=1898042 RepID=A0ABX8AUD5_9HYPH|nr:16S rRNA (guanine(966)-N(2))-methyltransferase RsmD [Pseudovibrio brasiliensis]QUS56846.1 16S rRNA (guanine(966)-N(2))-methyltransferase RsmD [Pseudovibrio brasiliensis]
MRIVAGRFRGTALATPKTQNTRPTTDRMRETIFNVLAHAYGNPVQDARVLDLFAGTGALGLEAMSRGSKYCVFVEDAVEPRGLIRRNVETTGLMGATKILRRDATSLGHAGTMMPFDLVFLDPPYRQELGEKALASAAAGGWLNEGALCIWEEDASVSPVIPDGFEGLDVRHAGDSQILIVRYVGL